MALPAAVAVPRLRLPLAALILAPPVLGWRERRPPMDPVRYVSARLLDDVAYSLGVWQGCVRHRTARPLLPHLTWLTGPASPVLLPVPVRPAGPGHRARGGSPGRARLSTAAPGGQCEDPALPAPAGPGSPPDHR